jgi:hypothetical protein
LALLAALAGIAIWSSAQTPGRVDVETEDDAIAALRLYLEQELAREEVAAADASHRVEVAARRADRVDEALAEARLRTRADVAARAYWGSVRHDELVTALRSFDDDLDRLEPPALVYLRVYVQRLPDDVVAGLRGHPLARPALSRLEDDTS